MGSFILREYVKIVSWFAVEAQNLHSVKGRATRLAVDGWELGMWGAAHPSDLTQLCLLRSSVYPQNVELTGGGTMYSQNLCSIFIKVLRQRYVDKINCFTGEKIYPGRPRILRYTATTSSLYLSTAIRRQLHRVLPRYRAIYRATAVQTYIGQQPSRDYTGCNAYKHGKAKHDTKSEQKTTVD